MMKKLIAICLLLMLTATSACAEWADGLSPSKPNPNVPESNLEEEFGAVLFAPNARMKPPASVKSLRIYSPRTDLKLGDGTLTLRSEDQGEEWSVAFDDADYVLLREMTAYELASTMMGSGTCIEIQLPKSLRLGVTYYVDMGEGCIDTDVKPLPGFTGEERWSFRTREDYGVSELSYRRLQPDGTYADVPVAAPGDEVRFDLVLEGDAKSALLYSIDEEAKIDFTHSYFTESGEVIGQVTGDDPVWLVYIMSEEYPSNDPDEFRGQILEQLVF